uniref:Uncharacterized protein n=1 Tax=Arion vulgaris TaxID=1028688 RepID=A0A0B7AYL9_9EUPU
MSGSHFSEDLSDDDQLQPAPFQHSSLTGTSDDDALHSDTHTYPIQSQPHSSHPGPPPAELAYPPGYYMQPQVHYGYPTTNRTNTTVILQQPRQPQVLPPRPWSSNLCECGRDWSICCCGFFCLCCLESEVAQDMDESCLLPCCVPGWLIILRNKMRLQENISGTVLDDCCHVCWCGPCSLCQLAYEIKVVRNRQETLVAAARPI